MNTTTQTHAGIKQVNPLPIRLSSQPKVLFTDVDDTLTYEGQLPVETFIALHKLKSAGISVIPVTGASAGWCDCLIKTWPISHIIGENGSLLMEKNEQGIVSVEYTKDSATVKTDLIRLRQIGDELIKRFPTIKYTQDQPFRYTDIAFDIGQTILVSESETEQATAWLNTQGVQARRSSIHINAWIGDHSKSTGALNWLNQRNLKEQDCLFIGDSPNDESMFEKFTVSVGVANIERFLPDMMYLPTYITNQHGGHGFVELSNALIGD